MSIRRDREDDSLAAPESTYLRTVISRYGGMIKLGTAVAIPPQPWHEANRDSTGSYRSRYGASHSVVGSGIPGYMGYVPHGTSNGLGLRNAGVEIRTSATSTAAKRHATDYKALNRSFMPKRARPLNASPSARHV